MVLDIRVTDNYGKGQLSYRVQLVVSVVDGGDEFYIQVKRYFDVNLTSHDATRIRQDIHSFVTKFVTEVLGPRLSHLGWIVEKVVNDMTQKKDKDGESSGR